MSDPLIASPAMSGFSIQQNSSGYRYSVEPFLLADWARPKAGSRILDVGTGCGIIPRLLLHRQENLEITAVEIQPSLFRMAEDNLKIGGPSSRVRLLEGDFTVLAPSFQPESFDWIVSNPPYRKINSGKINPCPEKAVARHELALTLESLVAASAPLLKPGGKIALAYPYHRMPEVLTRLKEHGLPPARFCRVFGHEETVPKIVLVEGVKNGPARPPEEETLTMYHTDGSYTQTLKNIYASFDYPERSHRLRKK